jgi:hypothetical protein
MMGLLTYTHEALCWIAFLGFSTGEKKFRKPLEGIEPSTYSLPRNRYTSKPQRHYFTALILKGVILLFSLNFYKYEKKAMYCKANRLLFNYDVIII